GNLVRGAVAGGAVLGAATATAIGAFLLRVFWPTSTAGPELDMIPPQPTPTKPENAQSFTAPTPDVTTEYLPLPPPDLNNIQRTPPYTVPNLNDPRQPQPGPLPDLSKESKPLVNPLPEPIESGEYLPDGSSLAEEFNQPLESTTSRRN